MSNTNDQYFEKLLEESNRQIEQQQSELMTIGAELTKLKRIVEESSELIPLLLPDISETAQKLFKKASGCASPLDRPGNWIDSGLIREFGMAAVNELVRAGLITHTGSPGMGYIDVIRAKPKT